MGMSSTWLCLEVANRDGVLLPEREELIADREHHLDRQLSARTSPVRIKRLAE